MKSSGALFSAQLVGTACREPASALPYHERLAAFGQISESIQHSQTKI